MSDTPAAPVFVATPVPGAPVEGAKPDEKPDVHVNGVEAPKPEEKPAEKPPEKRDIGSARFAALAKKEKGLVLKMQDLKAKEEALQAKLEAAESYEKAKAGAKLNPLGVLEAHGLTYDDITAYVLNDKKTPADLMARQVDDKLEAFKREQKEAQEKAAAAEKERIEAERKAVVEKFNGDCVDFVKANASDYELIHTLDAGHYVPALIQEHFERTQRVLSFKEAADLVEKHLEEKVAASVATKKWQARAAPPKSPEPEKRPEPPQRRGLDNGMTPSTSAFESFSWDDDRTRRALAKLEGK